MDIFVSVLTFFLLLSIHSLTVLLYLLYKMKIKICRPEIMHIGLTILYDLHKFFPHLYHFSCHLKTSKSTKYDDTFFFIPLHLSRYARANCVFFLYLIRSIKISHCLFYLSLRLFLYNDFFLSLLFPLYLIPEILDTKTAITTMNPFFIRQILNILSKSA